MAATTGTQVGTNYGKGRTMEAVRQDIKGFKIGMVTLAATVDNADTCAIILGEFGITTLWMVKANRHTTINSVLVNEEGTTSVSSGTLTFTVGGSTADKARTILLMGN